jgi:hypothetical protein
VLGWNVIFDIERVEHAVLITAVLSHHQEVLPNTTWVVSISGDCGEGMTFFNGIGHHLPLQDSIGLLHTGQSRPGRKIVGTGWKSSLALILELATATFKTAPM